MAYPFPGIAKAELQCDMFRRSPGFCWCQWGFSFFVDINGAGYFVVDVSVVLLMILLMVNLISSKLVCVDVDVGCYCCVGGGYFDVGGDLVIICWCYG